MGQIAYRGNLSSATYPMTISDGGRTVIVPGPDNNYDRRVDPTGQQLDAGIPQALYLENVMPTANGYQSVGFKTLAALPEPGPTAGGVGLAEVRGSAYLYVESAAVPGFIRRFLALFRGRNSNSNRDVIASSFGAATFAWTYATGSIPFPLAEFLSSTRVRGVTYVFSSGAVYEVTNPSADVLDFADVSASFTGIVLADVICIWSCANYLLAALSDGTVQWSSTTTPTDFSASLVSGAGSIVPNDLKQKVEFAKETINGFYLYTESEVVFAQYTGNARYPFKFAAVQDSGGYESASQVFGDSRSSSQLALDSTGNIRSITGNDAKLVASDLSNFLEKTKRAEQLIYATNTFSLGTAEKTNKLAYILDKFVAVQYTVEEDKYFAILDTGLNRYGKLKVAGDLYTDLTDFYFFGTEQGSVGYQMTFDIYDTDYTFSSALLLGKFQYVRSRFLKLEEIEIEGPQNTSVVSSPNFSCVLLPSLDGRNLLPGEPLVASYLSGGVAKFPCHRTAQNISVLLKGAFNVNTLQLRFTPAGDR